MSTYSAQDQVDWIMTKPRTAAHSARKRFDLYDAICADLEDMTQTAALTFWRLMVEGKPPAYAFVATREEARQCYVEQILGSGPRNPLSLDHPLNGDGDPPHERLAVHRATNLPSAWIGSPTRYWKACSLRRGRPQGSRGT